MADKITDLPGLSQWEQFNGINVDGKHYTPSEVSKDEGLSAAASGRAETIYESAKGGYTSNPDKAATSFSWDTNTGKIKISAPKSIQESDWFKNNFTNNDNFKAIAASFKQDPTGTTSLTVYDEDGNESSKTIQQVLEDYQKAFDDYSNQYRGILEIKDEVRRTTGGGIDLSDNNALIWASSTNRNSDKYSTDKVVYIPNIAMNYFDFSKIGSWNSDSNTISAKDFYEWYNLDDGTENKDELVSKITDATALAYEQYNRVQKNLSPEERDNETASNDYARTVSFLRTLQADNPEANAFTSTRLFVASAANSFVDNISQATGNLVMFVSDVIDGLDAADETIVPLKLVTEPLKFGKGLYQTGELMFYQLGATLSGVDISAANSQLSEVALIGDIADSISDGNSDDLLAILSQNMGLSGKLNAKDLAETQHKVLLESHDDMARLSSSATAGSILGGAVGEVLKQVAVTNPIGAAAGATVDSVVTGLDFIKNGLTASQLAGAIKVGSISANLMAQGLSDTILNDEASIRKMFAEGEPGDAVEALMLNTTFNGIGELTGLATTKGWDSFSKTTAGQTLQAFEQRQVAKVQYRKQRALASIAEKLNNMKKTGDEAAEYYTNWAKAEANASERIAHAGKYALEGETLTEATSRMVKEKIELEVAFTRVNTQTSRTVLQIETDPSISKQFIATKEKAGKVIRLEGATGVKVKNGQVSQYFTQDTSDYIALSKRAQELAHKVKLNQNEEAYLSAIQKRISDYRASHTPEFLEAVDDYVHSLEQYTYAFKNYQAAQGVIDADELAAQRATGLWGDDGIEYVHLQTIKGTDQLDAATKYVNEYASGKNYNAKLGVEQYSYKVGDVDAHYMDPQLAVLSEQIATAKVISGKEYGDALIKTQPFSQEVDLNGNPVSTKELNQLREAANYSSNNVFKKFSANDDILAYDFSDMYRLRENAAGRIAKKQQKIAKTLDMTPKRVKQIALDLDATDIMYLTDFSGLDIPDYLPLKSQAQLNDFYNSANAAQKTAIDQAMGVGKRTLANYNDAIRNSDLADRLTRAYISTNDKILNSKTFQKYATDIRKGQLTARQQTILKNDYEAIQALQKELKLVELGEDEFTGIIVKFTDDVVNEATDALENNAVFNEAIQRFVDAGVEKDVAARYLSLNNLKKELASSRTTFSSMLNKNLENLDTSGNLTTAQKKRYSKAIKNALKDNVDSEWADLVNTLQKNGAGDLVDTEVLFNDIRACMKDIIETKIQSPNIIRVLDSDGNYKLYEVSPTTATLYNSRPNFSNIKNRGLTRFFNKTNRIFRIMTTGWSLSSFENQWMRDPLNAYIMGGMVRGFGANTEQLGRLIGPNITEAMQKEMEELGWGKLIENIPEGETAGETIAANIRQTAEDLYGGTSEATKYYRQLATGRKESLFGDYEKSVSKMEKALEWMEDHSMGNFRETYLRKTVYMSNFNKALDAGKTMKEAANWAEYVADNATTDFSRAFAWGNQITTSVPYLGAAINGSKSFWRLLEVDPVGVSGRLFSGLIIPTMSLTAQSLSNDENREIYRNIPEYTKEDNIVFVVDGEVFKIPIPQELSTFVAPFRQLVEKAKDGSDEVWGELLLSDILGVSPIDLTSLADLDDPLGKDSDFWSRLTIEGEELISQIAPVAVKTAYMAIMGRDPYTHSSINREYTYLDPDGKLQIMDSEDNAIAKFISSTCRAFGIDLSPSSAEALLSNFFGQAAVDFSGSLASIFSGDLVGAVSVYGKQVSKPFTVYSYDQNDAAWKEVVKELQAEKQALMDNNSDLAKLSQQLTYATDPDKIKNLRAQIRQITQNYQDHVFDVVRKFNSLYGANYDYKKFASTINLLNFANSASPAISDAAIADAQKLSSDNRNAALATMSEMGFNSTNDYSIFGYVKTDANGKTTWKATLPTAIAYSENSNFYRGKDETVAKLKRAIERTVGSDGKTLKNKYKEMSDKVSELYSAKKVDYNAINKLYKEWDIELMTQIYPILAENDLMDPYGNSLLDNNDVIEFLNNYVKVPSDAMGKGKYYSSSTGLNKQAGYAKSYIQKIYKQMRGEK